MATMKHVKSRIAMLAITLLGTLTLSAAPNAQEILRNARINQSEQNRTLQGQLRSGSSVTPFQLVLDGNVIRYEFDNPPEALVLRLGEKNSRLDFVKGRNTSQVTEARFDDSVRGTDISYEDLSLRFLYWPNASIVGEDIVLTRNSWKLRLTPPSPGASQYATVLLWINKESGALVKAEGYDESGKLVKRFEVRSVQKMDGGYILKQMRIQRMQDDKPRDKTPTYLEINKG
jgi:outer membrane lipoprotein-sorting protein